VAAALSELLKAVDEYMQNNGNVGQTSGAYLASKFNAIFDGENSPFNTSGSGVLSDLTQKIKQFSDKVENLGENTGIVEEFRKSMLSVNIDLNVLKTKISSTSDAFDNVINSLNSFALNPMKFPTVNVAVRSSAVGMTRTINFFLEKLRKDFSSGFTLHAKRGGGEKRVYAIDVNLVNIKKNVFDDFFQQMQKRFSSESILSKPDASGKSNMIHSVDVMVRAFSPEALKQINSNKLFNKSSNSSKYGAKESGGFLSNLFGYITGGLALFGGLAGIAFILEKTELGKMIKSKLKLFGSWISASLERLLKSGLIEDTFSNIYNVITSVFSYIVEGTGDFIKRNQSTIWDLIGKGVNGIFSSMVDFMKSTFNFYGLKEKLGDSGSGIATILTKIIFKGTVSFITWFGNKLTFGVFGKVTGLLGKIPALFGTLFEYLGTKLAGGKNFIPYLTKNIQKIFTGDLFSGAILKPITRIAKTLFSGSFLKTLAGQAMKWGGVLLKGLKFVPLIGTLISFYSAWGRFEKGDVLGGIIDVASGIAALGSFFPGIGWVGSAISIGLDVFNAFLDHKQEGTGLSKGQMIGNFFAPITDWLADKFSYDRLKNMPVFGGFIRLGEGVGQITTGDVSGGLITILKAIGWMTPLPFLGEMLGFIDMVGGSNTTSGIPDSVKKQLNPDIFVESIVGWFVDTVTTIWDSIISMFKPSDSITSNLLKTMMPGMGHVISGYLGLDKSKDVTPFELDKSNVVRPNDTIIVEPHSKDQILMDKNGASVDVALKDMIKKIDEEIVVLRQGFELLIQATIQSSGTVAQAVAATASTQSSSSSSGRTPGHDFRQHAKNMIR
jgi:hypothetical protein